VFKIVKKHTDKYGCFKYRGENSKDVILRQKYPQVLYKKYEDFFRDNDILPKYYLAVKLLNTLTPFVDYTQKCLKFNYNDFTINLHEIKKFFASGKKRIGKKVQIKFGFLHKSSILYGKDTTTGFLNFRGKTSSSSKKKHGNKITLKHQNVVFKSKEELGITSKGQGLIYKRYLYYFVQFGSYYCRFYKKNKCSAKIKENENGFCYHNGENHLKSCVEFINDGLITKEVLLANAVNNNIRGRLELKGKNKRISNEITKKRNTNKFQIKKYKAPKLMDVCHHYNQFDTTSEKNEKKSHYTHQVVYDNPSLTIYGISPNKGSVNGGNMVKVFFSAQSFITIDKEGLSLFKVPYAISTRKLNNLEVLFGEKPAEIFLITYITDKMRKKITTTTTTCSLKNVENNPFVLYPMAQFWVDCVVPPLSYLKNQKSHCVDVTLRTQNIKYNFCGILSNGFMYVNDNNNTKGEKQQQENEEFKYGNLQSFLNNASNDNDEIVDFDFDKYLCY
jgi:hypothetical protein